MSRVKKLTDIEIDEVSVVDRPANQHGLIAFSKNLGVGAGQILEEESMPGEATIYDTEGEQLSFDDLEHGDVVYDEDGNEFVFIEDGREDEVIDYDEPDEVGKSWLGGLARNTVNTVKAGYKNPTLKDPHAGTAAKLGQHVGRNKNAYKWGGAATGAAALGGGAYAMSKSAGETLLEELSKAASEDDRNTILSKALDEIEVYKAATEELEEQLFLEQDARLEDAFISKAAEYNLPVAPEVLGPILKAAATVLTDEQLDVLDALFEAIGDALYEEVGYVGDTDNVSVLDTVDAYANELVGKADVSKAAAMVAMFEANPDAYDAYLAENGR